MGKRGEEEERRGEVRREEGRSGDEREERKGEGRRGEVRRGEGNDATICQDRMYTHTHFTPSADVRSDMKLPVVIQVEGGLYSFKPVTHQSAVVEGKDDLHSWDKEDMHTTA